jgi:hypothetical protein
MSLTFVSRSLPSRTAPLEILRFAPAFNHFQFLDITGLRTSLRENHKAVARLRSKSDLQSSRFLKVAGENAALKAGVQLLLQYPASKEARRTVEEQLRDLCERMGFDLLMVSGPAATGDGAPLASVSRMNGRMSMMPRRTARRRRCLMP